MVTMLLSPIGILVQQLANSGQPLSGGLVNTYVAGTTTPVVTYTDSTGTVQNSNPIVLNSAGRLTTSVWVPSNTPHKMILTDSSAVTLSTIDQLYGINDPFLINQVSTTLPTGGGTANAQTITNPIAITTQGGGTEQWYTPGVANTGATNINVDSLGNMAARYLTKSLVGGELQAGVPVILKSDGTFWNLAWSAKGPAADFYVDTGTVNAIVVTVNSAATTKAGLAGTRIKVAVANTNTSSTVTFTINGLTYNNVELIDGVTLVPPGALIANSSEAVCVYDFIISPNAAAGAVLLVNPSRVTGSYTGTPTGGTTAPTQTIKYTIGTDGNSVEQYVPSFSVTSNATTGTITGMPSTIAPTTAQNGQAPVEDSGTNSNGAWFIAAAGVILQFGKGAGFGAGNFTNSGIKAFPSPMTGVMKLSYPINP